MRRPKEKRRKKQHRNAKRNVSPKAPKSLPLPIDDGPINIAPSVATTSEEPIGRSEDHRKSSKQMAEFSPTSVLTWVMGAFSIVNLIHEFDAIKLKGTVGKWVDSYNEIVCGIATFLFGWIQWKWVSLDSFEAHLLVLFLLLIRIAAHSYTTINRDYFRHLQYRTYFTSEYEDYRYHRFDFFFNMLVWASPVFLLTIVMPMPYSVPVFTLYTVWLYRVIRDLRDSCFFRLSLYLSDMEVDTYRHRYKSLVRSSCIGTAIVVCLIICLNELL